MKHKVTVRFVSAMMMIAIIVVIGNVTHAQKESTRNAAGQELLQERCTVCHSLYRVENKKYNRARWEKVVARMIKKGAKLHENEQQAVIDYLVQDE